MTHRTSHLVFAGLFSCASFVMISGCQSTQTSATPSDPKSVAALDSDDGVVCKMERRVGSNMMTRVCRTAEERAAQEEAAREGMLRLQGGSMTTGADG
ncbi:hypothetical protein [Alteromonas oceanisediminis]|uniref:hypothetical protein n=1 Tax=Alteromonas oceanisediminis TaxID=2836180 RepID=UPI001BD9E421|nr:hypothetical protein [Alteromonas oceanisediminis]MBT0587378.1 hypothetical protein [Alteromonas oceanisediminis]